MARSRGRALSRRHVTSLAHVVSAGDLVTRTPATGIDVEPLHAYVTALENPSYPAAQFEWTSLHSARIKTDLPPNSVVSVQVSWSPGWHAHLNGRALRVFKDGLGFMYLVPRMAGPATISMDYDGGTEMIAARWISLVTLVLLGVLASSRDDFDLSGGIFRIPHRYGNRRRSHWTVLRNFHIDLPRPILNTLDVGYRQTPAIQNHA